MFDSFNLIKTLNINKCGIHVVLVELILLGGEDRVMEVLAGDDT